MRLVKNLKNGRAVVFDTGKYDDWCVYLAEKNGSRYAPYDTEYFSDLKRISQKYKKHKVYTDFTILYDMTTEQINKTVLSAIDHIVETYHEEDKELIEQWFAVIYAGMIAEENKKKAVLKKRIKRLGMHQVLILNMPPKEAANFSKGRKWTELDLIMKQLGF